MKSLVGSRVNNKRCRGTRRRPTYWTHPVICAIVIGIVSFAPTTNIVSGFLLHDSPSLPSQRDCNEQWRDGRVRLRSQAANDGRHDDDLSALELNDMMSRRQTLVALAASTATFFPVPTKAIAIENTSVDNDSRTIPTTQGASAGAALPAGHSTTFVSSEPSSFQESLSGFVAGATLAGTKTLVKFPLDTATVRVQMPNSEYSIRDPFRLFNGCFNGISLTLLSNIPAGAVFFGVKDSVKSAIKNSSDESISTMPRWLSTSVAVVVAMIPYWLVRNPSEVVKVRQQANIDGYGDVSAIDAVKQTLKSGDDGEGNNIADFYTGFWENVLYAIPADVIKFVAYESITKGRKDLSPLEGASAGALATGLAQFVSTPLDVVRNRLMTGKNANGSSLSPEEKSEGYIGSLLKLQKEEGLSGLFAGVTPRISKAILSGAIQFATYEETKQSMSKILLRR